MRNLTLERRIAIFKIFIIVFQSLINIIPNHIISKLIKYSKKNKIKRQKSNPKIGHETLCEEYKDRGLKNVNIPRYSKVVSLQCSWVRILYNDSFHIIPLHLIKNAFGNPFRFHSNLAFKKHYVKSFPYYYRDLFLNRKIYFLQKTEVTSCILSQNLWYHQYIQNDKETVHLANFSNKNINTVSQIYDLNNFL